MMPMLRSLSSMVVGRHLRWGGRVLRKEKKPWRQAGTRVPEPSQSHTGNPKRDNPKPAGVVRPGVNPGRGAAPGCERGGLSVRLAQPATPVGRRIYDYK